MEIDIPMKKFQVEDILSTYNINFLERHNLLSVGVASSTIRFSAIAKTKYGYMAVHARDYLTYLGDGVWSVTRNGHPEDYQNK